MFDWPAAARIVLAVAGCYVMAAAVAAAIARGLPFAFSMPRSEGTAAGTLMGMLVWPCSIVWVFAADSVTRIALVMGSITLVSALVVLAAGQPT
jgi:hypothetical protein